MFVEDWQCKSEGTPKRRSRCPAKSKVLAEVAGSMQKLRALSHVFNCWGFQLVILFRKVV